MKIKSVEKLTNRIGVAKMSPQNFRIFLIGLFSFKRFENNIRADFLHTRINVQVYVTEEPLRILTS